MDQSTKIFGALLFAFVIYTAATGSLSKYIELIVPGFKVGA